VLSFSNQTKKTRNILDCDTPRALTREMKPEFDKLPFVKRLQQWNGYKTQYCYRLEGQLV